MRHSKAIPLVLLSTLFSSLTLAGKVTIPSPRTNEPIQPIPLGVEAHTAKVELGKMLFFDPRLSKSGFISCNSCHNLATGGSDNLPSSIGHKWQLGPINSPTVLNARFNLAQFWDGRAKDLKEQAGGPIENPKEMASNHELTDEVLSSIPQYVELFRDIYGDDDIDIEEIKDAIAAFEDTLITPNSRFDLWLKGHDEALTQKELEGYQLFKNKGCVGCHNGVAVGGNSFQKLGIVKPYPNDKILGRFNVTGKESDKMVFKVPTLRNIELTAPYFHDARTWDLAEAVKLMGEYELGQNISDSEADKIVAFLKTLTGEQPRIEYPILPPSTAATPRPDRN